MPTAFSDGPQADGARASTLMPTPLMLETELRQCAQQDATARSTYLLLPLTPIFQMAFFELPHIVDCKI